MQDSGVGLLHGNMRIQCLPFCFVFDSVVVYSMPPVCSALPTNIPDLHSSFFLTELRSINVTHNALAPSQSRTNGNN